MMRLVGIFCLSLLHLFGGTAAARGPSGTLTLTNDRADRVSVTLGQDLLGAVAAGARASWTVPVGLHTVEVRDPAGLVVERSRVAISPGWGASVVLRQPEGSLRVVNDTAARLTLLVDGRSEGAIGAGELRTLVLPTGSHQISARALQHGRNTTLAPVATVVSARHARTVRLRPPAQALVEVVNRTGRDARLRVDGKDLRPVSAGSAVVVELPVGPARLELVSQGRVLDATTLQARPLAEQRFVAEAPTGEVLVRNPLPIDVLVLTPEGRSEVVPAGGSVRLQELEAGRQALTALRLQGEPIGTLSVTVPRGGTARATVPAPTTGVVAVHSDNHRAVTLLVDHVSKAQLDARAHARVVLPLGRHSVELRDEHGRVVLRTEVVVDRFANTLLVVPDHRGSSAQHQRRSGGGTSTSGRRGHHGKRAGHH